MNHLEYTYVTTIARHKSFSLAAKELHISQPALSNYITKLERSLGVQIFDRSTTPISLTEPGRHYVQSAAGILHIEKNFNSYLSDYNHLHTGTLAIGSTHCFTSCYLPEVLSAFLSRYPDISIKITEGKIPSLEASVLEGNIDLLITADNVNPKQFECVNIFEEELLLAVPETYPVHEHLAEYQLDPEDIHDGRPLSAPYVDIRLFEQYPFILLESEQHIYHMAQQIFSHFNFEPHVIMQVEQLMSSLAFSLSGIGISFITESAIRLGNFAHLPILYRIGDCADTHRTMAVAYKKNRYLSKACTAFIELMKSTLSEKGDAS